MIEFVDTGWAYPRDPAQQNILMGFGANGAANGGAQDDNRGFPGIHDGVVSKLVRIYFKAGNRLIKLEKFAFFDESANIKATLFVLIAVAFLHCPGKVFVIIAKVRQFPIQYRVYIIAVWVK